MGKPFHEKIIRQLTLFTIKARVSNILSKLGLAIRAEVATYAVQHKLTQFKKGDLLS
jgi:hypothetical protein